MLISSLKLSMQSQNLLPSCALPHDSDLGKCTVWKEGTNLNLSKGFLEEQRTTISWKLEKRSAFAKLYKSVVVRNEISIWEYP